MENKTITYTIWNPTGNITALVESEVDPTLQPETAARIMKLHKEVEQVGFVLFSEDLRSAAPVRLRMAGGEFCGNASMSAAALYWIRKGYDTANDHTERILLNVSGTDSPVQVILKEAAGNAFAASISLPGPKSIHSEIFSYGSICGSLPRVEMKGITHMIVESDSPFFELKNRKEDAEHALINWCRPEDPCVGLMFLDRSGSNAVLTPLVYVPASRTVFWENSCASGSSAVGMYLSFSDGCTSDIILQEPGGTLRVSSEPAGKTLLYGKTEMTGSFTLSF